MSRHTAPNHPDCWIECPDETEGSAAYIDPPGVCYTGCGSGALSAVLVSVAGNFEKHSEFNLKGVAHRVTLEELANDFNRNRETPEEFALVFGDFRYILDRIQDFEIHEDEFTYELRGRIENFADEFSRSIDLNGPRRSTIDDSADI